MRHRIRAPMFAALLALWALSSAARACDIDVREAGFVTGQGMPYELRPYLLYFILEKADPEAEKRVKGIEKLCGGELSVTNLLAQAEARGKLSEDDAKWLASKGVDLEKLPVSVILREGTLCMARPGLLGAAEVRALLDSPKRKELKTLLADTKNYCVFVFAPGEDKAANAAALREIEAALAEHRKAEPEQVVPLLKLDRGDPAEAFLLSELGVRPSGKALAAAGASAGESTPEPLLAVVFGKGRVLIPPAAGEAITKENLGESFAYLNHNASDCTVDAVFVSEDTFDLLMHWEPALENRMLDALAEAGVELYNPWAEVEFDASGQPVARTPDAPDTAATPDAPTPAPAPTPAAAAAASGWMAYTLPALAGVLVLVLVVGWFLLRRKRAA